MKFNSLIWVSRNRPPLRARNRRPRPHYAVGANDSTAVIATTAHNIAALRHHLHEADQRAMATQQLQLWLASSPALPAAATDSTGGEARGDRSHARSLALTHCVQLLGDVDGGPLDDDVSDALICHVRPRPRSPQGLGHPQPHGGRAKRYARRG